MNWLSFVIGIATGIGMILTPMYVIGRHLKKHPEVMVKRMTRAAIRGMNADSNVH